MKKIFQTSAAKAELNPLNKLKAHITKETSKLLDPSHTAIGCESEKVDIDALTAAHSVIESNLTTTLAGIGNESASAMAYALMVCSDSNKMKESMVARFDGLEIGNESFAGASIVENLHLTVGVAGELATGKTDANFIFPQIVIDQAKTNYKLTTIRTVIEPKFYHNTNGGVTDWGKINLMDAAIKSDLLRKRLNVIIPELSSGKADKFVADEYITPWELSRTDGTKVVTSYLGNSGEDINIAALSTAKGIKDDAVATILDRIDEGASIDGIIVGLGAAIDKTPVYLSCARSSRSRFARNDSEPTGNVRNVMLGSTVMILNLDEFYRPEHGEFPEVADIAVLKALKDAGVTKLGFKSASSFTLDLSTTTLAPNLAMPKLVHLETTLGGAGTNVLDEFTRDNKALITPLAPVAIGFDFQGTLSNDTLKIEGDKLGTEPLSTFHPLQVRTPIEFRKGALDKITDAQAIKCMAQAVRLRRDDESVEALHKWFNWAESNLGYEGVYEDAAKDLSIIGLFHFTQPYVRRVEIDLNELLKEHDTTGKLDVLEAGLVTRMQDILLQMFQKMNYTDVARSIGTDPDWVPMVALYADSRVGNYIMRTGEDRTFGDGRAMQKIPDIHVTNRDSMANVVYAWPQAKDYSDENDRILGFAHSVEIVPIAISRARDNGTVFDQIQLYPVYENVITTPGLIRFEIKGLEQYFERATVDKVSNA